MKLNITYNLVVIRPYVLISSDPNFRRHKPKVTSSLSPLEKRSPTCGKPSKYLALKQRFPFPSTLSWRTFLLLWNDRFEDQGNTWSNQLSIREHWPFGSSWLLLVPKDKDSFWWDSERTTWLGKFLIRYQANRITRQVSHQILSETHHLTSFPSHAKRTISLNRFSLTTQRNGSHRQPHEVISSQLCQAKAFVNYYSDAKSK